MEEIEQLLQKFSGRQITVAELKKLHHLLEVNKDQLSADALSNFTKVQEEIAAKITAEKSDYLLQNIHHQLGFAKKGKIIGMWYKAVIKMAVAAAVIGFITINIVWLNNKTKIATKNFARTEKPALPLLQSVVNSSTINKFITLDDNSVVELMPKSAITYYKPFINNHRDISIIGTAFFKVAKNKTRPFTVYANGITTTALGTQFWVYANTTDYTGVHLLEGKVVIKASKNAGVVMADVYLVPGQKFSFDKLTNKVAVNNAGEVKQKEKSMPGNSGTFHSNVLVFDNEPVENVLQKIQQAYKQPLSFNKADVKGLVFTGTFLHTDDLQIVLSALCNMNDLSFEKTGGGITISKRK